MGSRKRGHPKGGRPRGGARKPEPKPAARKAGPEPQQEEARRARREEARALREREVRRRRRFRVLRRGGIVAGAAVAVLAVGLLLFRSQTSGVSFEGDLRVGGRLESFALPALQGDGTVSYDRFRGTPMVINFFASWCPYCIDEMPDFEQVHQRIGPAVAFLGVSQSDSRDASIELMGQTGVSYPAAYDAQGRFYRAFGSLGMPVTAFIRADGEVADVHTGQLSREALLSLIQSYFGLTVG